MNVNYLYFDLMSFLLQYLKLFVYQTKTHLNEVQIANRKQKFQLL